MKDVRGAEIDHDFIERVTFVIGKDHRIVATLSSADDKLSPDQHVERALDIVQKLAAKQHPWQKRRDVSVQRRRRRPA